MMTFLENEDLVVGVAMIIFVALVCWLLFGLTGQLDYKTKDPSMSVGAISETGELMPEQKHCIYTKKLLKCTSFKITREFGYGASYQIHYYGENGNWLCYESYDQDNLIVEEMPEGASAIRVVVINRDATDGFSLWERWRLNKHIKIEVMTETWLASLF